MRMTSKSCPPMKGTKHDRAMGTSDAPTKGAGKSSPVSPPVAKRPRRGNEFRSQKSVR